MSEQDGEAQHVLVAVTGSVAAIKVPELVKQLTLQQESKVIQEVWQVAIAVWRSIFSKRRLAIVTPIITQGGDTPIDAVVRVVSCPAGNVYGISVW